VSHTISSKLLIEEQPLQVLPSLAKAIGLDEALFLQQVHYWLKNSKHEDDGRRWVYNSYEDWLQQLPFFSQRKLERIVKALKARGLLLVRRQPGFDRRNWYSIDYQAFNVLTESCDIQRLGLTQIVPAKMAGSTPPKRQTQNPPKWRGQMPPFWRDHIQRLQKVQRVLLRGCLWTASTNA
jgi:hypothetical protein